MRFEKPDRLPWYEWPYDEAVFSWIKEGLPIDEIRSMRQIPEVQGALTYSTERAVFDVSKYFGFEFFSPEDYTVIIDQSPIPRFYCKTLEDNDRHTIIRSVDGTKKKIMKHETFSMPMWLDWPIKTRDDWNALKVRFDPSDSRRYPKEWRDQLVEFCRNSQFPIVLWLNGFFMFGRTFMGTVRFISSFYKDPELLRELAEFHSRFTMQCIKQAVEELKSNIDYVAIGEDLAYKHGPHLSPKLFREFMLPGYKKVTGFLRQNGIENIFVDTDGDFRPLIPLFLEGGVDGFFPLEAAAGIDAVELRREYGKSVKLIGNIDKRALFSGKAAIEKEVDSKVPFLKESGGYIPMIDHVIPPGVPLENFKHYVNCIKKHL
jgi:uroporphyrinogen decarboxylase